MHNGPSPALHHIMTCHWTNYQIMDQSSIARLSPSLSFSLSSTCQHAKLMSLERLSAGQRIPSASHNKRKGIFYILIRDEEIKVSHSIQLRSSFEFCKLCTSLTRPWPVHRINLKVCINHIILSSRRTCIINFVGYQAEKFKGRCFQS